VLIIRCSRPPQGTLLGAPLVKLTPWAERARRVLIVFICYLILLLLYAAWRHFSLSRSLFNGGLMSGTDEAESLPSSRWH
jgi:hypothetical protein